MPLELESFGRHVWHASLPRGYTQHLLSTGLPFDLWVSRPAPSGASAPPEDPDFLAEKEN